MAATEKQKSFHLSHPKTPAGYTSRSQEEKDARKKLLDAYLAKNEVKRIKITDGDKKLAEMENMIQNETLRINGQ